MVVDTALWFDISKGGCEIIRQFRCWGYARTDIGARAETLNFSVAPDEEISEIQMCFFILLISFRFFSAKSKAIPKEMSHEERFDI